MRNRPGAVRPGLGEAGQCADERSVVVVAYPRAELLDIACVTSAFDVANRVGADPPYGVRVVSPGGRPVGCQSGLTLASQGSLEGAGGPIDTLLVSGGLGHEQAAADARLVAHVRRLARESRRVASVCTGATVLAATGLLDGRRATTHWLWARRLATRHPRIKVDPAPIFIHDGNVSTAAGVTSALDLTLAFIADDHGRSLARQVARGLVAYLQRPGHQAQMSLFVSAPAPDDDVLRGLVETIARTPDADLGVEALSRRAGVSARHLTRLFVAGLGQTPARYVRRVRAEAAVQLLTSSTLPVARVASRCGFGTVEALRHAMVEHCGLTPSRLRAGLAEPSDEGQEEHADAQRDIEDDAELGQRPGHHDVAPVVHDVPDPVGDQRGGRQDQPGPGSHEERHDGQPAVPEQSEGLRGERTSG